VGLFDARLVLDGSAPLVVVSGELDIATEAELRAVLEAALAPPPPERLVVDVSGLRFVDLTGLAPLLAAGRCVSEGVRLRGTSPALSRLRSLLALESVLPDEAEAADRTR
jgi:anti-anti-sigma factor